MLDRGYGIMPNKVLFDKELSDKAKLLFCFISSLCAEKGFCRAGNKYIAERMGMSERTVREHISILVKHGYINLAVELGNQRKMTIGAVAESRHGGGESMPSSGGEIPPHNITINNNTKENSQFETFWNLYPKKVKKKTAMQKFNNLSQTKQKLAIEAIQKFKTTDQRVRGFIPDPTTYINQERREDEIETKKQERPSTLIFH